MGPPSSRPLYERWPYPDLPLSASIGAADVWQLHADWLRSRAGLGPGPDRPRVWVAGCGAWQCVPIAVGNPQASVLGTDVSDASLAITRQRLDRHHLRNVTLAHHDLDQEPPAGPFDWIECFGVLMNLADPGAALARIAAALAPDGVVRLMVYPWFGRRRVFQIARIAQLVGLGYVDERHPGWLRALMGSLPPDHPLRFTFDDYADAANPAGVVDGFLHVSGVAFSAHELFTLVDAAGLELAAVVHRPWGDPWGMGEALGLSLDPWATLYALDLWQELKSNLIVILRRKGAVGAAPPRLHPAVDPAAPRGWADAARLWLGRAAGLRLQDRTHPDGWLELSRAGYAELLARHRAGALDPGHPLVLFGDRPERAPARGFAFPGELEWRRPRVHAGPQVPNPAWDHQLRAFTWPRAASIAPREPAEWLARWEGHAFPLEDDVTPYGFSPITTWARHGPALAQWLSRPSPESDWSAVRLADEGAELERVRRWLRAVDPSLEPRDPAGWRELWSLTYGYREAWLSLT
ncbi:MAG: class I SAM-dependent methyltransferase [Myxococcota bacterium]